MLAVQNISLAFSGEPLFRDVSFVLNPGDRAGLVGSNGAGKTTLLRVIMGRQEHDRGNVSVPAGTEIGYLPQDGANLGDNSVREEVASAFSELRNLEQEIVDLTEELSRLADQGEDHDRVMERLGEAQHRFEALGGFQGEGNVEKILMGLGFLPEDLDRHCSEFSGGWRMRIELAKLLLRKPDVLLLDEPTNHLDIESLTWLEEFLKDYPGAILLISHDRAFLDGVTNRTFELTNRRLEIYTGNYSKYREERAKRRELQMAAYVNQQKMIEETTRFIERFRYKASKAVQVQSRVKALDRLERIEPPEPEEGEIRFSFPPADRSGRVACEITDATKSYGDNVVLENIEFAIERGERIALLGRNGEGKSTLSRMAAGIEPFDGNLKIGHNVSIGYYAQNQAEELDPNLTALETIEAVESGSSVDARTLLGAFLFKGDDVFKKVRVLSGGEKSRLALAKLLLQRNNLLILDEPTNHLDMASKSVLKQALLDFDGALLVVSHDRVFLQDLLDKVIEVKDRSLFEHLGGIDEYLQQRGRVSVDEVFSQPSHQKVKEPSQKTDKIGRKEQKRLEAEERNRRHRATREIKERLAKLEGQIAKLEQEKETMEKEMADPDLYDDPDRLKRVQKQLGSVNARLAEVMPKWEEAARDLEKAEGALA